MWVAMSRGSAAGILVATFATGALGGWFFRGTKDTSCGPAKSGGPVPLAAPAAGRETASRDAPPPAPPRSRPPAPASADVTPVVKPSPTPGHWFRLAGSDTLSEIARRAYGTTRRTPEIERANPALDPTKLRPGTLVYIPVAAETAPPSPPPAPDRSAAKPAAKAPTASK